MSRTRASLHNRTSPYRTKERYAQVGAFAASAKNEFCKFLGRFGRSKKASVDFSTPQLPGQRAGILGFTRKGKS